MRYLLRLFLFMSIALTVQNTYAQLSDLHYLPPLKQGQNNAGIRQQAVYLSTPEPTPFTVNIYRGTNPTPIDSYTISNVNPEVYPMSNGDNNIILVNNANTGVVLTNSGLRFEAPSGNRFYVNYRGSSNAQSASLTSKGRQAMGTNFKWGGVPNRGNHPSKSNTLGIMATEDNTTIDLFGYDPGCEFRVGNDRAGITANTHQITLDANESFVYETYIGDSPTQAHEDGWIGASIVSDKDIVISNGAMNFGRQVGATNRDAGIDQPVPENRLGKEYVFVRGNGNPNGWTEFPLLIAISDNTQIFVNGSATPIATIDNGDYFEVPSNLYSSNTVGANMLVQTSKDVYAYQCLAGATQPYTQGLNFVAPVNCLLPDTMDNIPDIRNMAGTSVTGGLTIIAAVNTPDANIVVTDGNGAVTLPPSNAVSGSTDWKTFYIPNLNGNVSVQSTGPMAVGFFGFNGARGVAGYFSGFDTVPEVTLEIRGGTGCFVGSEIYEATNSNFDAFQWYKDGVIVPGANSPSYAPDGAGEYFLRGTKGPCTYDSNPIFGLYCDPDVHLEKSVDKAEIMEGETATFTIRVQNWGVGPLTNLQITDNIPTGLTFVNAFTITGNWSGNTWNIGTLDGGEVAELELEVRGDEIDTLPLLSLTNTATNSQDQTDTNITEDSPSAKIVVHNDYDNDGINDVTDLDDDNDGVYDEDECSGFAFNISGGASHTSTLSSTENYMVLDLFSLDNSFSIQINGTDLAGEMQFQNEPGNFARFMDGFGYGENGNPQVYSLSGSHGTPLIRIVIDAAGQLELFGARTSNGPLEPMELTTPPNAFTWSGSGSNTVVIDQAIVGPTNMQGVLLTAGCDTDSDGIPDQLDLDSDGDGCSDANEFYKDNDADGGDDGAYGAGAPVVDTNDGTVNAASYTRVFAPEILLGNTSEDLGGVDINGQNITLGQSFNYVLRFQNTGDDNATNYSIRDVLPNNVTLDNIDVSDATGTTHSYDINTRTITFQVPDNLVEVGDPEYSIKITVTTSGNCSDFVAACSSQLENLAFSTYQGDINSATFTDEGGATSTSACDTIPEVASNNIRDDLANCNQARTVQLCGASVVISAGSGFGNYIWAIDNNNNGQIDSGDTLINNGDHDNDPSTLQVTEIGNYIVEKSAGGSCPDLIERIRVERFGTTQTNPIIDYFNQVNSDSNPDNDLQGEIVTCSVDGDLLPKIFLCGENDEATIQLGISDAQSIVWQQLDESSCDDSGDDCANKNFTCSWTDLATQDNFTLTDSGEFRVVINYQNGCFSRFYFNVFKNNLDIDHTASDILCTTPGNIRITNIGTGYGFQLVDVNTDAVIVPFSDDNGPNFDIAASGTYKVQITQLDPISGDPIAGSCVFETEDIGIVERDYQVNLSSTLADCNELGTISVQALNVFPVYSYELRLDDGSNAGQGTFVTREAAINDNTHTFEGVSSGDYIVITTTDEGCSDTQQITVDRIPQLTLSAVTDENITCTSGIIILTPDGGLPSPDYEMAIWSKDGTPLYTDAANVPDSEKQTATSFLFGYSGSPATYLPNEDGDYQFIVFDGNGCSALSNVVRIEDLGSISLSASHSAIVCADSSTSTLTVNASGGTAPYRYSTDGGTTYQNENTFVNLQAGFYTITVMDSSGSGSGCVETIDYEIDQPFRLTASPTIVEDASCNPSGARVKILNANGGQAPYEYSFDGGSSFNVSNERILLPGTYQLQLRDALGCAHDMDITVPAPTPDPNLDSDLTYNCDGTGTITINSSNPTDFDYTYALNGTDNTPIDSNSFTNVADGTHTITVGYSNNLAPSQSTLFLEDFGAGPTTQIGEVGPDYCYEPQDGSTTTCNRGPAGILVNGEYTVTNFVTNPIPSWTSPQDHTGLTDGRFLAIDVSTFSDTGDPKLNTVLWARRDLEVLPNEEITLNFWAYNLMDVSGAGNNPEILVEILDNSGTVIHTEVAPEIPKNTNDNDWHERTITFDPGANTDIDIVFRTNVNSNDGNDLVLDDITAYQLAEVCEKTEDLTVVIETGRAFEAQLLGENNPLCNGSSDGSIRFEVSNFDAAFGFEYSLDGGTSWTSSTTSPVTTPTTLADGNYTIMVRKVDDNACTSDFTATLTEPSAIVPQLSLTADYTCFNTGATLEASATGGTPGYQYQLEDGATTVIRAYQNGAVFNNVPDGSYVVRVRDANNCDIVSTTPVTVNEPETVGIDLSATACYDNQNNATITATVNTGNGDYTFRLNGGAWLTPTPATANTYTFNGLSDGTYTVEVSDAFGCTSAVESITINPNLQAQIDVIDISSCADGSISVNASGGDLNYVYAYLPTGTPVQDSDFGASNTFAVTSGNAGDYDVYLRDNGGTAPYCQHTETVTVDDAPTPAIATTPTDAECFGETGNIEVNITSGTAPFTYQLIDTDNGVADETQTNVLSTSRTYFNLLPGQYDVIITDASGCPVNDTGIVISQPTELTADIDGVTPATCTGLLSDFGFSFSNYPVLAPGTIEFSADGGSSWTGDNTVLGTTDELTGYASGSTVNPSMRTVDTFGNTICQTDLPPFIIPFPLDDLDITILPIIVNCNELQVTVRGSNGTDPYEYTYTDDPANFNQVTPVNGWTAPLPTGTTHTFPGLVPGKTYAFYVRDAVGCVRQSSVNVNDVVTNPMEIDATFEPSCDGADDGEIIYTLTDTDGSTEPEMRWELFDIDNNSIRNSGGDIPYSGTISVTGLAPDEYYIVVEQVNGGTVQCTSGSENLILEELDPITASLSKIQDISCEGPGIILVDDIQGGGGTFNFTVTGPAPFSTITGTADNPIEIPANSPAGSYSVSISDQYNCSAPLGSINMSLSANPTITSIDVDNCSTTPTVTVNATSASPTILYSLDGGTTYENNGGIFNNVAVGSYTIFIKDGNGCTASQAIDVYPSLQAEATIEEILGCGSGNEAEIEINVTSGSGNYDYEIVGSSSTFVTRQVLPSNPLTVAIPTSDTYTVTVFDNSTTGPECERSFTLEIAPAVTPDFTVDANDVTCFGASDGIIAISEVNNGVNPLTYTLSPNNGTFNGATNSFENLPPDTYQVTGTGQNGCTLVLPNIVVAAPNDITFTLPTVTPFGCSSGNTTDNTTISIDLSSITGGSGTYVRYEFVDDATSGILQNNTSNTYSYTDIAGGDVTVRVYDDNGCSGEMTVTVPAYDELLSTAITVDREISCTNSGEDITIDVTGSLTDYSSDPANYQFRMLPSASYQASNQFLNLGAGNYTFGVRHVITGCELTIEHVVEEPNTFDVTVEKLSDAICFGDNGSIRLTLVDATYTGGFSWNIFDTNGTPADRSDDGAAILTGSSVNIGPTAAINVPAGNYLMEVTQDAFPDCTQVRSFNITTPSAPVTLATIDLVDVGCSNDQGSASINPLGGQAPYDISLTHLGTSAVMNVTEVNGHIFQGLSAGQYDVSVTDALGCTEVLNTAFELLLPDPITGTISNTDLACQGDNDASVTFTLNARNVSADYRHVLNKYSDASRTTVLQTSVERTSPTFDNLNAGFYAITILDDMGCVFETSVVEIENPTEVTAQLTTNQELTCDLDAELLLAASGGTVPYTWSADGISFSPMNETIGTNKHLFTNVTAGTYEYYVQDSENCISILSNEIPVNPIQDLILTVDETAATVNCNGDSTAVISATAEGGLGDYRYALFSDLALTDEIRPNQMNGLFADLPEGNYYVRVQSGDCETVSEETIITEPTSLTVDSTISDVSCNGEEDGSIVLEVQGGTGPYQFAISPNLNQFVDENSFDELAPGDYIVIAQDMNGCFEVVEFTISEPDVLTLSTTVFDEICFESNDGAVTLEIEGGTAPYFTSLNSNDDASYVEGILEYSDLPSGSHLLYVRDSNGCETSELIEVESGVNLAGEAIVSYPCESTIATNEVSILLEDITVSNEVLYGLDTVDPTEMVLDGTFENLTAGDHFITVAHSNGCTNTFEFTIVNFEPLQLQLSQGGINTISALAIGGSGTYSYTFDGVDNGDDSEYYIRETDTYTVTVTDENGCSVTQEIFMEFIDIEIPNFFTPDGDGNNDVWQPRNMVLFPNIFIKVYDRYGRTLYVFQGNQDSWDGQYQLENLPSGDYWYIIKLNGESDTREFIGNFTLYR